jgi:hypothetical protein
MLTYVTPPDAFFASLKAKGSFIKKSGRFHALFLLHREAQFNFKAILMKWLMEAKKYRQHKIMVSLESLTFLLSGVSYTFARDFKELEKRVL